MEIPKQYLGDSVYVAFERGMLRLATSNGFREQAVIWLEPAVYAALVAFVNRLQEPPDEEDDSEEVA